MGAEEKDGDVPSVRTALLPHFLGGSASGSKEGGPRDTETNGGYPGGLRGVAGKLQRLNTSSRGGDEEYRVAACLASYSADRS